MFLILLSAVLAAEEKSAEEAALDLIRSSYKAGVCATLDSEGSPYQSVMPFVIDKKGNPIVFISDLAEHTENINKKPNASFMVMRPDEKGDHFNGSRATMMGKFVKVPHKEDTEVRKIYLEQFKEAKEWAEFGDFHFYRLELKSVYYIGGFGDINWLDMKDYRKANNANRK